MKVNKINNDLEIKEGKGILLESSICLAWIELLIVLSKNGKIFFNLLCQNMFCKMVLHNFIRNLDWMGS